MSPGGQDPDTSSGAPEPSDPGTIVELVTGPPANGGSCIARHDGRVVFVRYALPGFLVHDTVTTEKGSH